MYNKESTNGEKKKLLKPLGQNVSTLTNENRITSHLSHGNEYDKMETKSGPIQGIQQKNKKLLRHIVLYRKTLH